MRRRRLRRTGIEVTELGFGGAPLGGLYAAVDDGEARAALEAAWEAGIRYFDTAPLYGFGLSEQRIGAFLRTKQRDAFVLSTKVGRTLRPRRGGDDRSGSLAVFVGAPPKEATYDFSADAIERSIEESLMRLGLTRIDIVYVHDPDDHFELAMRETYPILRELRERGVVRAIGVGMNRAEPLAEFVRRCDPDVVMLAGRYTILDRTGADELFALCVKRGVAVVAAGIFNSGILSQAVPRSGDTFDYAAASSDIVARAQRLAHICERYGTELPTAALRFPLEHPAIACAVIGMRSAEEVRANVARLSAKIPAALWPELAGEALREHARHR